MRPSLVVNPCGGLVASFPGMTHQEGLVVHAIGAGDWAQAGDDVRPVSLTTEGFIHLSRPDQIAGVCNALYADRDDLVLLLVDPAELPEKLVWEDCYDTGQAFPHLYAPLPRGAVVDVKDYPRNADGTFATPELDHG